MGRLFNEPELRGKDPIWILEVTIGGHAYRFATEIITIQNDGSDLTYEGTLSGVDFGSELSFGAVEFEIPTAQVTVVFSDDIALMVARGADFGAATAELALWIPGEDYDDRRVVVRGGVQSPSYGGLGEAVGFSIEPDWMASKRQIPGADQIIATDQWPALDPNCEGKVYPVIIGAPGRELFMGSPGYVIDDGTSTGTSGSIKVMIAGHRVHADSVDVKNQDGNLYAGKYVYEESDPNGNIFSWIRLTAAEYIAGDSYFVSWIDGGGMLNPFGVGVSNDLGESPESYLTNGGDLVRYLLGVSGVLVDEGRTAAAAAQLNGITFDGFLGERTDPLEFVIDEIGPLLPMSLLAGADGLFPVAWRYDARKEDARATLIADQDVFREGLVEYEKNPIENEITLRYRFNARFSEVYKATTITGDDSKTMSGLQWRNDYSAASFTRYGTRTAEYETEFISRRASAGRVLGWMIRANAFRRRSVAYSAPVKFAWLNVGDIVAITDPEISFNEQLMMIRRIDWAETDLAFEFLLIPDLPRDTIPLG